MADLHENSRHLAGRRHKSYEQDDRHSLASFRHKHGQVKVVAAYNENDMLKIVISVFWFLSVDFS